MIDGDAVVAAKPALVLEDFDDALLMWDEEAGKLHHLDPVASAVWGELDGKRTLTAIATALAGRFSADPAQVRGDVISLVARLHDEGLVIPVARRS